MIKIEMVAMEKIDTNQKRKRGRPKGSKNKINKNISLVTDRKKKRGRPKKINNISIGSKKFVPTPIKNTEDVYFCNAFQEQVTDELCKLRFSKRDFESKPYRRIEYRVCIRCSQYERLKEENKNE